MGHLINPMAFRVGWSQQWIDDFFVEARFYPEFLHRLLRFRYFLNSYFQANNYSTNPFDEHLVSHFRFSIDLQGFTLFIYYYSSRIDPTWYVFFDKINDKPFGLRFFPRKWTESSAFSPWNRKFLSLLFILYHYSANGVLDETFEFRSSFFQSFENNLHAREIMESYAQTRYCTFTELSPSEKECFILLYTLRFFSLQEVGRLHRAFRGHGLKLVNYELVAQDFFRFIYLYHITRPFLNCFALWFKFLGHFFFLYQPISICFLQISNDQVSARFLAKFLALRFSQGQTVRATINPIRKDLRLAKKYARRLNYKDRSIGLLLNSPLYDGFSFFVNFVSYSQLFDQNFFSDLSTQWSFDQFFLASHLLSQRASSASRTDLSKKIPGLTKKTKSLIKQFSRAFYKTLRLFFEKRFIFHLVARVSNGARKLFFFSKYSGAFFMELFNNYHVNYESSRSSLDKTSFFSVRGLSAAQLLYLTGGALFDFLKFSLNHPTNLRSLDTVFPVNRFKNRSFVPPALGLNGFRIRLHGRFTRKQIASSYHFQEGAMPLSSLDSTIDYGFATVPLRNSAVGVKVWLYRQGTVPDHDYSFFF